MKSSSLWILFVCAGLLFSGCDSTEPQPPPTNSNESPHTKSSDGNSSSLDPHVIIEQEVFASVLFEAEAGKVIAPVQTFEDAAASGGVYLLAPEGPDHEEINKGGGAEYVLDIPEAGEYVLWIRANWSGGCGNSLGIMLDGKDMKTVGDATYETWHWVRLERRMLTLSAGKHTLMIESREDGSAFDQILLTEDVDARPSGVVNPDVEGRVTLTDCKPVVAPPPDPAPPTQADGPTPE